MEWDVVTTLVVLIGLFLTVGTPMLQVSTKLTKNTQAMEMLTEKLTKLESRNTEAHKRLWDKNEEQDKRLDNHELRIHDLEIKG